jgi:hypothetical protein
LISSATPAAAAAAQHAVRVEPVRLALEDHPPRRVADHVDPRTGDRPQQAVGHLGLVLAERRMHRGDDDVELREAVVGEVHRAVGRMSHSMPASTVMPSSAIVELADARAWASARTSSSPLAIASARLWSVMAMYSSPAARAASAIVSASRGRRSGGVHVQVATEILSLDQPGKRPGFGRRDFSPVLAQLGGTNARPSAS